MAFDQPSQYPENPSSPTRKSALERTDLCLFALLVLLAAIVLGKDLTVGGPRYGDGAVHIMDGVLIHDWIAAGPSAWVHPMKFAEEQYGHYPALGTGRHYPPGFAMVEAVFLAIFGISPISARLCVIFFGAIASCLGFLVLRRFVDRTSSFLCGVFLITLPASVEWGRQEMLEVPTLAALCAATLAFAYYRQNPTRWRLGITILAAVMAILFKQSAVFFVVALAIVALVEWLRGRIVFAHVFALVSAAIIVVGATILSLSKSGRSIVHGYDFAPWYASESLSYYARSLPMLLGWPILVLSLVGVVLSFRVVPAMSVFLVAWAISCYAMVTCIGFKEPRYFYFGLLPFAIWAAIATGTVLQHLPRCRPHLLALVTILCCVFAFAQPVEHRPDYGSAVVAHRERIAGKVVLFSGLRDADFVLAVRQHLPWRSAAVIRGSKLLYDCAAYPELSFTSHASSKDDVAGLLRQYGLNQIFLERENKTQLLEDELLREYCAASGDYALLATHSFRPGEKPSSRDVTLDVYEAAEPKRRIVDYFDIPSPRAGRTIRVDLKKFAG